MRKLILAGAILMLFWAVVAPQLAEPLIYDEVDFVKAGGAIARTAVPYYNRGYIRDYGFNSGQYQYALYHPPLYVYVLGASFVVLGQTEFAARFVGMLCGMLTLGLTFFIARKASPIAERSEFLGLFAMALLAINPYFIQSVLLIDIDGSVQLVLIMVFFALYFALRDVVPSKRVIALSLAFLLVLWSKATTVFALTGTLFLIHMSERNWRRALQEGVLVSILGIGAFLLSWSVYASLINVSFGDLFLYILPTGAGSLRVFLNPRAQLAFIKTLFSVTVPWITPIVFVGLVYAILWRIRRFWSLRRIEPFDVLFIFGYIVFYYYLVKVSAGFPKYQIAALPFLSICIAYAVGSQIHSFRPSRPPLKLMVLCLLATGLYGWFVLGDAYFLTAYHLFDSPSNSIAEQIFSWMIQSADLGLVKILQTFVMSYNGLWQDSKPVLPVVEFLTKMYMVWLILCFLPMLVIGIVLKRNAWMQKGTWLAWSSVVAAFGLMLALDLTQLRAGYSTRYFYGDSGWAQFAQTIKNEIDDSELYVADRDIAYYVSKPNWIDAARFSEAITVLSEKGELYVQEADLPRKPVVALVSRGAPLVPGPSYMVTIRMDLNNTSSNKQVTSDNIYYLVQYR